MALDLSLSFSLGTGFIPVASNDVYAETYASQGFGVHSDSLSFNPTLYAAASANQVITFSANATTSSLATPLADFDPARNITLGGTMLAAGTTPPAVTLTGTLLFATGCPGIRVEITTGGARGTALFRVSYNNGVSWALSGQTTAATFALGGAATGVTLNFASATYATDNVYQATVATWGSREGNAYTLTNATAAQQPVYFSQGFGTSSVPYFKFDGTDDRLVGTISAVTTAFASTNPYTLFYQARLNVVDASHGIVSVGNSASGNGKRYWGQSTTGFGRYNTSYRNDAGTALNLDRSTNDADSNAHCFEWYTSAVGTEVSLQVDGGAANPSVATSNSGTSTPDRVCIGCEYDNSPALFFNGDVGRVRFHGAVLNSSQRSAERTALAV